MILALAVGQKLTVIAFLGVQENSVMSLKDDLKT
jgi:hypothetical protein